MTKIKQTGTRFSSPFHKLTFSQTQLSPTPLHCLNVPHPSQPPQYGKRWHRRSGYSFFLPVLASYSFTSSAPGSLVVTFAQVLILQGLQVPQGVPALVWVARGLWSLRAVPAPAWAICGLQSLQRYTSFGTEHLLPPPLIELGHQHRPLPPASSTPTSHANSRPSFCVPYP